MNDGLVLKSRFSEEGRRTIDISCSSNLYLTEEQGRLFGAVLQDPLYNELVSGPLRDAESSLPALLRKVAHLPGSDVVLVDLGPSTAAESLRHLQTVNRVASIAQYVVVDVNSFLLSEVADQARFWAKQVKAVNVRFEEIVRSDLLDERAIFLMGGTVMNYDLADLKALLESVARKGDLFFLQSLVFEDYTDRSSIDELGYGSVPVFEFVSFPLRLIGVPVEFMIPRFESSGHKLTFNFQPAKSIETLDARIGRISEEDLVCTAFSRRVSPKSEVGALEEIGEEVYMAVDQDKRVASSVVRI